MAALTSLTRQCQSFRQLNQHKLHLNRNLQITSSISTTETIITTISIQPKFQVNNRRILEKVCKKIKKNEDLILINVVSSQLNCDRKKEPVRDSFFKKDFLIVQMTR